MIVTSIALAATGVTVSEIEHVDGRYVVASIDLREARLDLFGQGDPTLRTFDAVETHLAEEGRSLLVATNGGMYQTGYLPVGLQIENGVEHHPLATGDGSGNFYMLPNGVFALAEDGPSVVSTSSWTMPSEVRLATQSGPMLVIGGKVHPDFNPESTSRFLRNGVCASDPHTVHLAISLDAVRLYDFATLMQDVLGCSDALYLDGTISAMRYPGGDLPDGGTFGAILAVSVPGDEAG